MTFASKLRHNTPLIFILSIPSLLTAYTSSYISEYSYKRQMDHNLNTDSKSIVMVLKMILFFYTIFPYNLFINFVLSLFKKGSIWYPTINAIILIALTFIYNHMLSKSRKNIQEETDVVKEEYE